MSGGVSFDSLEIMKLAVGFSSYHSRSKSTVIPIGRFLKIVNEEYQIISQSLMLKFCDILLANRSTAAHSAGLSNVINYITEDLKYEISATIADKYWVHELSGYCAIKPPIGTTGKDVANYRVSVAMNRCKHVNALILYYLILILICY